MLNFYFDSLRLCRYKGRDYFLDGQGLMNFRGVFFWPTYRSERLDLK